MPAEGLRAGVACFAVEVIQVRKVQKEIDVIATFRIGEPPEPHRFRIEGLDGERYEYRIGEIRDIRLLNVFGDRVWNYECCGLIGGAHAQLCAPVQPAACYMEDGGGWLSVDDRSVR